jgi:5'(3')-deoxyribonucleotidase
MSKQGFWTGLKPYEAGLELYRYIAERFETYILTKALKECSLAWKEKVDWVHKYIGNDVGIMVVTEKKLVKGDLLFDDLPENCHNWLETNPNGRVIMPNRRYNTLRVNEESRINVWNDNQLEKYTDSSGSTDTRFDFSVPHKVINEILGEVRA